MPHLFVDIFFDYFRKLPRYFNTRVTTRKPCCRKETADAAAVLFGLKFADNMQYKFKSSQASKARLQSSKNKGAQQNLTQNGHSWLFEVTCFLESVERR